MIFKLGGADVLRLLFLPLIRYTIINIVDAFIINLCGVVMPGSSHSFKTMGNASIQLALNGKPVLTTDPWLVGRAYFDSWALHHPFSEAEIQSVKDSPFIWISHGHPDHLHPESLELLPRDKVIMVADLYSREVHDTIADMGFEVRILPYKKWVRLSPELEVLCLDNVNQDAILLMRFGDALLINLNDSPLSGEFGFLKRTIAAHPNDKIFAFKLLGVAADMLNFINADDQFITDPADDYKPGCVRAVATELGRLGVKNFCMSSAQHIFVRKDSRWANDYDIGYEDILSNWTEADVDVIEPFVTYDLETGEYSSDWPQGDADKSSFLDNCGEDDWSDMLSEQEWAQVEAFFAQFETVTDILDFIIVEVGGERRKVFSAKHPRRKPRGVRFVVPKHSLLETIKWGYFDDLLIGNFMKTELINMHLYPDFSPRIAKYGGNAKVFSARELRKMHFHYLKRNPIGMTAFWFSIFWKIRLVRAVRDLTEKFGVKRPVKWLYNKVQHVIPSA